MVITLEQLKQITPKGRADLLQAIVVNSPILFREYGLTTKSRVAHFLAQIAHESDGFKTVVEYASGDAYEGRKDLGNTQKGDGRKYKGRGYIQLTGRANYATYGNLLGLDLINNPKLAEIPLNALRIALEYWKVKKLNQFADKDDVTTITKRINGGTNGLQDRINYLNKFKKVIQVTPVPVMKKEEVEAILPTVGAKTVEEFQEKKGLVVDGVVGDATRQALDEEVNKTTLQGKEVKPTVTDILKSPEVIAPTAVTVGGSLVGALTSSLVLQIVVGIIVLAVFCWIAYKKIKEEING